MENKKMLAKLKTGKFYNRSHTYSKESDARIDILNKYAGAWVEIETEHLFNDQYNITLDGVGIRIFDADITEIQNDARVGACKCGYCGKTFSTLDDYKKHVDENKKLFETKEHCAKCFWNQSKIIDTKTEKSSEIDENGDEITKKTTTYTWHKECVHGEKYGVPCSLLECANEKYLRVFTPQNTYFLKYPKGYDGYFRSLSFDDKMCELHFDKNDDTHYIKHSFVGSYNLTIELNASREIKNIILANTRKTYVFTSDLIREYTANYHWFGGFCYNHGILKDFPKTYERELSKAIDAMRDKWKRNDYINEFLQIEKGGLSCV